MPLKDNTQSQAHKLIAAFSPQTPNREQIDGTAAKVIGEEEGQEHTRQGEKNQEEEGGRSGCERNLHAKCPKLMPLEDNLLQTQPQAKKLTPRSLRLCSLPTPNPKPEQIDGTSGKVTGEEEGKDDTKHGKKIQEEEEGRSGCDRKLCPRNPKHMPLKDKPSLKHTSSLQPSHPKPQTASK